MVLIVAVLIGLVCIIQAAGDALVRAVDHRR
jgi:ABC-type methionine transport system permease subunit